MFLTVDDIDLDGNRDIIVALDAQRIVLYLGAAGVQPHYTKTVVSLPGYVGRAKAVRVGDVDLDGFKDVVVTTEGARDKVGVFWLKLQPAGDATSWDVHPISGVQGAKYDLVELIDLDGDGDLDAVTTEENAGLGLVWYENPTKRWMPVTTSSPNR